MVSWGSAPTSWVTNSCYCQLYFTYRILPGLLHRLAPAAARKAGTDTVEEDHHDKAAVLTQVYQVLVASLEGRTLVPGWVVVEEHYLELEADIALATAAEDIDSAAAVRLYFRCDCIPMESSFLAYHDFVPAVEAR